MHWANTSHQCPTYLISVHPQLLNLIYVPQHIKMSIALPFHPQPLWQLLLFQLPMMTAMILTSEIESSSQSIIILDALPFHPQPLPQLLRFQLPSHSTTSMTAMTWFHTQPLPQLLWFWLPRLSGPSWMHYNKSFIIISKPSYHTLVCAFLKCIKIILFNNYPYLCSLWLVLLLSFGQHECMSSVSPTINILGASRVMVELGLWVWQLCFLISAQSPSNMFTILACVCQVALWVTAKLLLILICTEW